MRVVPAVAIMKHCSHDHCRRVSVVAEKVSDFWVTKCEDHRGKSITLGKDSMDRLSKIQSEKRGAA